MNSRRSFLASLATLIGASVLGAPVEACLGRWRRCRLQQSRGYRARLNVHNNTLSDLHLHWTQDVHEREHWDYVANGDSKERESQKVDVHATFKIGVHRNDAGQAGKIIGTFSVTVYGYESVALIRHGDWLAYTTGTQIIKIALWVVS